MNSTEKEILKRNISKKKLLKKLFEEKLELLIKLIKNTFFFHC